MISNLVTDYIQKKGGEPGLSVTKIDTKLLPLHGPGISVQPKHDFGIGNQNQGPILITVLEPNLFFTKFFLQNFFYIP